MSFASPVWLLVLLVIPALLALGQLAAARRRRYALRFPALATAALAAADTPSWRRRIPAALLLAAATVLTLALARPKLPYHVAVQQASMMLVSDHSGSMAADDVQPTRLAAAISAADAFIAALPDGVQVGAIGFSSAPDAIQGPVADHSAAKAIIDDQVAGGATDTGDALSMALTLLHGGAAKHPPSAIVLLSDGAANTGADPVSVARQAAQDRIPIYTVALGTPGGVLTGPDPLQPPVPVPPDPALMAELAQVSGGRAFNAQSADQLSSIYNHLASQLGSVVRRHEVTADFALAGLALLGLAVAASLRFSGRLP